DDGLEVGPRLVTREDGAADHGVGDGGAAGALVGSGEQPALAADGDGPERARDAVVVELDATVLEEADEVRPLVDGVGERLAERRARWRLVVGLRDPGAELGHERGRLGLAPRAAGLVIEAELGGLALERVDALDE